MLKYWLVGLVVALPALGVFVGMMFLGNYLFDYFPFWWFLLSAICMALTVLLNQFILQKIDEKYNK